VTFDCLLGEEDLSSLVYRNLQPDTEMPFFSRVFMESVRLQPGIMYSTPHVIKKRFTTIIGKKKLEMMPRSVFMLNLFEIHRDPDQWSEPDKFKPERFDPDLSEYHTTPRHKKRKPYSFSPFFVGTRMCTGRPFAEMTSKAIVNMFVVAFPDLEFVDEKFKN